jgi:FAD:protein FMN transferase
MKKILLAGTYLIFLHVAAIAGNMDPKAPAEKNVYTSHFENVLGTSLEIKIKAASQQQADKAESAALQEIARLANLLSAYDSKSEFCKWMKTYQTAEKISPELFAVLQMFDQWKQKTGGALDASAQVISQLWKESAASQTIPTSPQLQQAVAMVQQTHWKLDEQTQTAVHLTKAPLILNSFTKSYIIQKATETAKAIPAVQAVLINIGGDMVVSGNLTEKVGIADPRADAENDAPMDQLSIQNLAVATSGNYRRGNLINGNWYSHIVDPRTGMPVSEIISATVVSPNATDAGALATAFTILSPTQSASLAATTPGTEYLLITKEGERIESNGWKWLTNPTVSTLHPLPHTADQWNPDFELVLSLELAQIPGFARRPYVAVWVEDKDKNPVRTISLWYSKDRWLHDLRAWYNACYIQYAGSANSMSTISSATRSAGKYTLKWDGKDDKGNYVKPGTYTICIEAAREHGTYQMMRQEMNFSGTPQTASLTGNVEIAGVTLVYKKK